MDDTIQPIMRAGRRPAGPVCFEGAGQARACSRVPPLRLADRSADALAELLPLLLCGEESAALAFGSAATRISLLPTARAELDRIGREEAVHGRLLQRLRAALPVARPEARLLARMRRFLVTLADADAGRYFSRIAGLDSAVCIVLAALRGRRSPLAAEATVAAAFARIHRDEAGHVDAARRIALAQAPAALALDAATQTRRQLVELLRERGAAFEQLGVDADALFARLAQVSRGVFG